MRTHIKETSKSASPVLCEGNLPVTGEFPAQRASNAEKASVWWRHRDTAIFPNTHINTNAAREEIIQEPLLLTMLMKGASGVFASLRYVWSLKSIL